MLIPSPSYNCALLEYVVFHPSSGICSLCEKISICLSGPCFAPSTLYVTGSSSSSVFIIPVSLSSVALLASASLSPLNHESFFFSL